YTKVKVGDKLVIKNPAPAPVEDEEGEEGDDEFGGNPGEEEMAAPVGTLYFSFDGTQPTRVGYDAQEEDWELDKPYSTYKIFKAEGVDVEITFGQDEEGYYAYVPVITEVLYMPGYDTIRLGEDGHFNIDVWCMTSERIDDDPMAWMPKYFNYGSDFVNGAYTLKDDFTVAAPTFDPEAGEVEAGTAVEIACATENAKIYYTVDGSEPTAESTLYEEAIEINEAMTVKAIAIRGDFKSEVKEAAYTVKGEPAATVAKPTFNPAAGEVEKGTKVTVACTTEGATIYYTVDGTEPTEKSTQYKEAIEINEDLTIKAIAVKGDAKSEVAEAAYTVKVANEN
ncbi:MAG: chitobiase/beta-hexosaminidase C-terminal domain-containing protein, partial [Bacteroidales bacterium]|nr:chitobiase/beta-hexosaminidase C-terminal domain-containing protein [Bacteroidales bacterium]